MKSLATFLVTLAVLAASHAQTTNLWQNTGNIGIGTTSPGAKLEIDGGSLAVKSLTPSFGSVALNPGGPGYAGYIEWYKNGPTRIAYMGHQDFGGSQNNLGLNLENGASFVVGGGNVGIGVTSPVTKLDVAGSIRGTTGVATALVPTIFGANHAGIGCVAEANSESVVAYGYNYGANPIFRIAAKSYNPNPLAAWDITNSTRLLVTADGNVGIGTTNPGAKLHIVGPTFIESAGGAGNPYAGLLIGEPHCSSAKELLFGYDTTNDYGWVQTVHQQVACTPLILNAGGGNVGIGTTNPTEKLSVKGRIRAQEVVVDNNNWSDYVLANNYRLAPLSEVEQHIQQQGHLPGVPSAQEVAEKGVSVGDMQAVLLAKLEEVTLHLIAQEKRLDQATAKIDTQAARIAMLEAENALLKK